MAHLLGAHAASAHRAKALARFSSHLLRRATPVVVALLVAAPTLAHGEEYLDYLVVPVLGLELVFLAFAAFLAPPGKPRALVVAVYFVTLVAVAWFFYTSSSLTGSPVIDIFAPVLLSLAFAIPLRLRSAT